jgi:flagellar hook-associated protein 3 FlgL
MRITSHTLLQNALRSLRGNLETLAAAQQEAATGRRVNKLSDDPVDASQIMRIEAQLRDVDQFQRNAAAATTRLSAEDAVLTTVRELLDRAKSIAIATSGLPSGDPLKDAALAEAIQIRDQLIALGNTKVGNDYIFGGAQTTQAPFLPDGTYVGDTNVHMAELDDNVLAPTNHTGDQFISGAIQAVVTLTQELQLNNVFSIQAAVNDLATAAQEALQAQTEVGSRLLQIKQAGQGLARRVNTLLDQREGLRDADPAVSLLKVTTAQNALERAYAVVAKVFSTNLLDYLK